jgi:hypothetical protein
MTFLVNDDDDANTLQQQTQKYLLDRTANRAHITIKYVNILARSLP